MHCRALQKGISSAECCEYVLGIRAGPDLAVCRACKIGMALMAWARKEIGKTSRADVDKEREETMPEPEKSWTIKDLALWAGVSESAAYKIISRRRSGLFQSGPSFARLKAALRYLGLDWDDLEKESRLQRSAPPSEAQRPGGDGDDLPGRVPEAEERTGQDPAQPLCPKDIPAADNDGPVSGPENPARPRNADVPERRNAEKDPPGPQESGRAGIGSPLRPRPDAAPARRAVPGFSGFESHSLCPSYLPRDISLRTMPLEDLLREITRRLPGAEIVFR